MANRNAPSSIGEQLDEGNYLDFATLQDYINEEYSLERLNAEKIHKLRLALDKKREEENKAKEVQSIKDLTELKMFLERQGIKTTQKIEEDFAQRLQREKTNDEKKRLTDYWKQYSKNAEKERKKEDKAIERQLKVAKLRSKIDSEGEEKSIGRRAIGTLGADIKENFATLKDGFENSMKGLAGRFMNAVAQMSNVINSTITTYAGYRGTISARLQGSSYGDVAFKTLSNKLDKVAFSGLVSASDLYQNLNSLVSSGISANVDQLALLQTMKDVIAPTFDVTQKSLRQLIRIQQQDNTAIRLGMESYLTKFLNSFVQTSEYLTSTFDNVADALYEASSIMSSAVSTEFEYTVQKWLGALTGVGLGETTANAIATAIGQLGSGNISALSSSNLQNLVVMASSKAGLEYGKLLSEGLTASDTNKLMSGMVAYLQELNQASSNITRSKLAETFGVSISDLVAVSNLSKEDVSKLIGNQLTTTQMYSELYNQFDSLTDRLGQAKVLENLFSNFQYSTGMNIANNPALYAMWKVTDMIQGVTGGINIPTISVLGNSIDLNTTVENLMKLGIVGTSTFSAIKDIIDGVGQTFNGSSILDALSFRETELLSRGEFVESGRRRGLSTSASAMIGQGDESAYTEGALYSAKESAQREMDAQKEDQKTAVDILEEAEFVNYFKDIRDDIHDMATNGVMQKSIYSGNVTGLEG